MKPPEKPPEFKDFPSELFNELGTDPLNELLWKANREYWPWEEFKYKTGDLTYSPKDLWRLLKFLRRSSRIRLSLLDKEG